MQIDRLSYSESIEAVNEYGLKLWRKFGAEMTITPTDNLDESKKVLLSFVKESLTEKEPDIPVTQLARKETKSKSPAESIIDQLNTCTELKVLESYALIAKTNPEIMHAYDVKFGQLVDAELIKTANGV